jgi:putative transposase
MILSLQQGLADDGFNVSLAKLCQWFGMPRRTVYYRSTKAQPKIQEDLVKPIKAMIEENPSFGYRTVAHLLGFNKNTVQRIFQLKGWQVRKRSVGFRPRIQALPSVAKAPNERWATDLCRVWTGRDGWASLALVIDCYSRELLGWHLSRSGRSRTAESALEQALIARYGCLGKVRHPFLLRSDNGLVFTSRSYTTLVRSYGLQQEFITPYSPEQNGMVERVIRTLKDQCVHRHRFESLQHASRVIADWIGFYNHRRPHQALGMKTPRRGVCFSGLTCAETAGSVQWWSLIKKGGHLVLVVPDEDLYEQGYWPSRFKGDHKATFTLKNEKSWSPVSYNIRDLVSKLPGAEVISGEIQDKNYDYDLQTRYPPKETTKVSLGLKVLRKIFRKIPLIRHSLLSFLERKIFLIHHIPIDQTKGQALAQIQVIAKKG